MHLSAKLQKVCLAPGQVCFLCLSVYFSPLAWSVEEDCTCSLCRHQISSGETAKSLAEVILLLALISGLKLAWMVTQHFTC